MKSLVVILVGSCLDGNSEVTKTCKTSRGSRCPTTYPNLKGSNTSSHQSMRWTVLDICGGNAPTHIQRFLTLQLDSLLLVTFPSLSKMLKSSTLPVTFPHTHPHSHTPFWVCIYFLLILTRMCRFSNGDIFIFPPPHFSPPVSTGQDRAAVAMAMPSLCPQITII